MASAGEALETYRRKRQFDRTPEPKGGRRRKAGWRYAIQKHDATRLHYDLRLELDGVLKSWAITKGPSLDPSVKRLAVRTEDHPLDYIDFEGTIPKGNYGAGTVLLWDQGHWEPLQDPAQGLRDGKLSFRIEGQRLHGTWALVRFKGKERSKRENWLLIKEKDAEVEPGGEPTETAGDSVKSGRSLKQVAADRHRARQEKAAGLPSFVAPQLATLVTEIPARGRWLYELKFDGYRALAAVDGAAVRLSTRNGKDWTERFASLADALGELGLKGVLLDGEVVAADAKGRSDFGRLQRRLAGESKDALSYFVFDLLAEQGRSLRGQPLSARKRRLKALLGPAAKKGPIFYTDHLEGDGATMLRQLCERGFEGMIAKKADAPYRSGRSKAWLKLKCDRAQEFVVVGWSRSDKERPFASLLLGYYDGEALRYAGRVGTGFSDAEMSRLARRFRTLGRKTSPLAERLTSAQRRGVEWLRAELVAQVAFTEFTADGLLRHPRYLGLREDKPATKVRREEPVMSEEKSSKRAAGDGPVEIARVRLTHPDRVLFPQQGLTKRDLARYLERAAPRMLPHLAHRLVSLVRCPEGRAKSCFFQRHGGAGLPQAIARLAVAEDDGGKADYLHIDDVEALVAAAQMGALEFHIWGSHIDRLERPDRLVFDLDPAPDVDFPVVRQAALEVRALLQALGLESFPLLTGGKGVHVVAPLERRHDWPLVKAFAAAFARHLADQAPQRYLAVATKAKRSGRIFVDYLRNARSATAICPFSPRAREGAPVAWPLDWTALERSASANGIALPAALERLAEPDPWDGYDSLRQLLTKDSLAALGVETT